ncbi:ubiquinol-cytochrome c reductase iron-sulfur subunit [Thermaurantiacus sp.]
MATAPDTLEGEVRRRDFIYIATGAFTAVGAAAVAWPFINQMNPSADVRAMATTDVDLSGIQPGMAIKTIWQSKPVFVKNLTAAEIAEARKVSLASLRDPQSLADRTQPGRENWLVTLGVCTHLGCVPLGAAEGESKGDFNGFFCPCHGSHYDVAGRIRKGPAPKNLEVPPVTFKSDTLITIG